jgi:hypothetical protein
MRHFLFLMHADATTAEDFEAWGPYIAKLQTTGHFEGGSSIGGGETYQVAGQHKRLSDLVGYLIVGAENLSAAQALLQGNPTYVAGGTVEIRELIED